MDTTTTPVRGLARGASRAGAAAVLFAVVLGGGAAHAKVPEGWSDPDPVSWLTVLWLLIGIPVGLVLLITFLVYVPALVRGERLAPGEPQLEDEWFGGPRQGSRELAAPDTPGSRAGGASGHW